MNDTTFSLTVDGFVKSGVITVVLTTVLLAIAVWSASLLLARFEIIPKRAMNPWKRFKKHGWWSVLIGATIGLLGSDWPFRLAEWYRSQK